MCGLSRFEFWVLVFLTAIVWIGFKSNIHHPNSIEYRECLSTKTTCIVDYLVLNDMLVYTLYTTNNPQKKYVFNENIAEFLKPFLNLNLTRSREVCYEYPRQPPLPPHNFCDLFI